MEDLLTAVSVPAIAAAVYWVINLVKYTTKCNEKILRFVPLIACGLGVVFSLICYFAIPAIVPTDNVLVAIVIGGLLPDLIRLSSSWEQMKTRVSNGG